MLTKIDDAQLLERWQSERDGDAFAELARRHAPVVFDLAARTLGDRTAAEDVVQEALLDLALEPTRKPAEVGVVAWLARFAICRARNQRSSERCRAKRQQVVGRRRPEETMPDDLLERREELDHALASAATEERAVLAMRFLHGWEYDRIAQALETSEGAARVRVHRALSNIRERLGVGKDGETAVARGMAGLALIPLPAARLDTAIRSAIDAAGPTPASSSLPFAIRTALQGIGAVAVLGVAAVSPVVFETDAADAGRAAADVAAFDAASAVADSRADGFASSALRRTAPTVGIPRPEGWDNGAMALLASGGAAPAPSPRRAPARTEPAPDAAEPPAPAAAPAASPEPERPSSAFRPSERGASAANCDPGSSEDERADALGGLLRAAAAFEAPERHVADEAPTADRGPDPPRAETTAAPEGPRAGARAGGAVALDAAEKALLEQAAALVREVVANVETGEGAVEATPGRRRAERVRTLKREVRRFRGEPDAGGERMSRRKAARLGRVLASFVGYALAGESVPGQIRWPDGIDVTAALQDLIRVLAAAQADAAARRPDLAEAEDAAPEAADAMRLPELR